MNKKFLSQVLYDKTQRYKHFFRIMKITTLFLFALIFCLHAENANSQNVRVSIKQNNVELEDILNDIEKQTDYLFVYNHHIDVSRIVSVDLEKRPLEEVLNRLFTGTNVKHRVDGSYIILSPRETIDKTASEVAAGIAQQGRSVAGTVIDQDGEPVIGVNVVEKGTTNGVITDMDGRFSFNVSDNAVLLVSYIGYMSLEIPVRNQANLHITLKEDLKSLDEVVVIGYGTVRRRDLMGSVSQISSDKIERVPSIDILQAVQGRIPGLQITPNSGRPGAGSEVLIHGVQSINGTNAPIYVVDGTITESVSHLNPQDIETFTVLKDASAVAIYGSRAANGVIVINTKRGDRSQLATISFKTEQSFQQEGNLKLKFLNAGQWLELLTEAYQNGGRSIPWTDNDLLQLQGVDNCWPDLMKRTGYMTNNNISISGGSQTSNYFVSLNYLYNEGIIKNQDYQRVNLRLNGDHIIRKRLKFGHSVNIFAADQSTQRDYDNRDTYHAAFRYSPFNKKYGSNGDYAPIENVYLQGKTPSPLWMLENSDVSDRYKGIEGNLYLAVDIMEGLKFTTRASAEWTNQYSSNFIGAMAPVYKMEGSNVNKITKTNKETFHWITDFLLDYQKTFKENHSVNALLGYSLEKQTYEDLSGSRGDTPSNDIQYLDAGDPGTALNNNSFTDWSFISMFGRAGYSYKDRYYLSGTLRRDGTSRLVNNKYGGFPSVSAAWRIGDEVFMDKFDWLNELKLRASWGKVGNVLSISPYGTAIYLSQMNAVMNDQVTVGYSAANAVNTDLKWESTEKKNIGLDITLLNNSIYFVGDFYIEDTYDLLFNQPIPYSVGLSGSPYVNAGHVRNTGIDIELGYRKRNGAWSYDFNVNLSHVKNEVIDLEGRDLLTSGIKEGHPVRSFFGYKTNGLIRTKEDLENNPHFAGKQIGDIWFLDIDGYDEDGKLTGKPDGKVDAADRTLFGKVRPDLVYGIFGSASYKNVTLQLQLQGVQGMRKNMRTGGWATDMFTSEPNMEADYILDRFDAVKNPNGKYPRVSISDSGQNLQFSDFWLVDASYLSIRNVNLNYRFPDPISNRFGMKDLNVYFSIQNLWTFGNEYAEISNTVNVPIPRTCTFGLKFSF